MSKDQMWAYISGFFDGEGCVSNVYSKNSFRPSVQIPQSGEIGLRVLTEIAQFLKQEGISYVSICKRSPIGGGVVERRAKSAYKDCWVIHINRKHDVVWLLSAMIPFLRVKKVITQDHLRFAKLYPDRASFMRRKTHCVNGHELSPVNVHRDTLPGRKYARRRCKVCHAVYISKWLRKKKAGLCQPR